jgi:hypothetical protein
MPLNPVQLPATTPAVSIGLDGRKCGIFDIKGGQKVDNALKVNSVSFPAR